eukprot:c52384_g1_i1.p1 GENE.c52384_g1_i1~~c52384_g1_i1.p1  ORF type:complete len:437 (-),score=129.08 c52384_g1_i1:133-1443(-)
MRGFVSVVACLAAVAVAQISNSISQYPIESEGEPLKTKVVFSISTPEESLRATLPRANLIVGVVSSPEDANRREAVRSTWMQLQSLTDPKLNALTVEEKKQMVIKFVVGQTADTELEASLISESAKYGDIVRVPVREAYFNLTLKTGEFFRYAVSNYNFDYAFKCDDDSFVRIDHLLEELKRHGTERVYMGKIWTGTPVDRRVDHFSVYKEYSPFAAGAGYALSRDLVEFIVRNWDNLHKWPMEDVAVGMWLYPLNVNRVDHKHFHSLPEGCDKDMIVQNPASPLVMKQTFFNSVKGIPCHAVPDPFDSSLKNVTDHVLLEYGIPKPQDKPSLAAALQPQMLVQTEANAMLTNTVSNTMTKVMSNSAQPDAMLAANKGLVGDDAAEEVETRMTSDDMNNNIATTTSEQTMNVSGATETVEHLDAAFSAAHERMNML